MRFVAVVLLAVLCALLVPVPATAAAARHQVMIMNFSFSAPNLSVRVGDTITWTNHDDAPHDVVSSAGPAAIRSPMLQKGQSWSTTVTAAGTYALYCSVHPDMRAQVVVLAPEPVNPPPQQVTMTTAARAPVVRAPVPTTTTTAPPTTSDASAVPQQDQPDQPAPAVAAQAVVGERLDPMLIVAGIVAAVAVLCLLMLSARPDA